MVFLAPAAWACAVLAALRFEEILLPPVVKRRLPHSNVGAGEDGMARFVAGLLPPWQQALLHREERAAVSEAVGGAFEEGASVVAAEEEGEEEEMHLAGDEDPPSTEQVNVQEEDEENIEEGDENNVAVDGNVSLGGDGEPVEEEGGSDLECGTEDEAVADRGVEDASEGAVDAAYARDMLENGGGGEKDASEGAGDDDVETGSVSDLGGNAPDPDDALEEMVHDERMGSPEEREAEPISAQLGPSFEDADGMDIVGEELVVGETGASAMGTLESASTDDVDWTGPTVSSAGVRGEQETLLLPDVEDVAEVPVKTESISEGVANGVESQPTTTSLDTMAEIAAALALTSSLLSVIYALAVHSFLSFFHERSFCEGKHWLPILLQAAFAVVSLGSMLAPLGCLLCVVGNGQCASSSPAVEMIAVIVVGVIITFLSVKLVLQTRRNEVDGPPPPHVSMKGKVVLVTGANSGIGLETSRQLYEMGATIILGCRSRTRAEAAKKDIIGPLLDESSSERVHILEIDLSSLASVHKAVESFLVTDLPLHVLINNAGLMRKDREETKKGLEVTMAANVRCFNVHACLFVNEDDSLLTDFDGQQHLGHFLLTSLLLPKLRETAASERRSTRVVNVSSSLYRTAQRCNSDTQKMEPGIDLDDLLCQRRKYSLFGQYAQSKLANVLFSLELGRRERERCNNLIAAKSTVLMTTPTTKQKKKIRPRLTPVENPDDDEEVREGSGHPVDAMTTPPKKEKKKMRPKLTPVENPDDDEGYHDGVGLGFDHIVASSPSPGRERKKNKERIRPVPTDHNDEKKDDESPREVTDDEDENGPCLSNKANARPMENGELTFPVLSFCLHPGLVRTDVVRNMPWYLRIPNSAFSLFVAVLQKHPRSGAFTSVYCAVTSEVPNAGCYYVNSEPQPLDTTALNADDARRLWEQSETLTQRNSR